MKTRFLFAAMLGGVMAASAAFAAQPPAVFVAMLYAPYKDKAPWTKTFDPCAEHCVADLAKLIKAAKKKNMLDYDPICQCKAGGDSYMMFSGSRGATDEDYLVTMMKVGKPGTWVLKLKWVAGDWKIEDIVERLNGKQVSLRQRLAAAGS